jgi:hypothetical protein
MNKPYRSYNIIEGTFRTAFELAGMIPVGIVKSFAKEGGAVDKYIEKNIHSVRQAVGAVFLLGAGISVLE